VECGPVEQVFENPQHEYARQLVRALPQPDFKRRFVASAR
jgi:ABC-type dipeptide/oligopeptide/nickel transport system ATPase component